MAAAILLAVASGSAGQAQATQVTVSNLQAIARSLAFVETLQHRDMVLIGVVYDANDPHAKAAADDVVKLLQSVPGPNSMRLQGIAISTDELAKSSEHSDALFLMAGTAKFSTQILSAVRRDALVSVSDDTACLDNGSCVLMVRTDPDVEIVLNTQLAASIGARFSAVFTMMVKRK
jgi:hypothetical protein